MISSILMLLVLFLYTILVIKCAKDLSIQMQNEARERVVEKEKQYQKLIDKKNSLYDEKMALESEAIEIFTLYEITKDITVSLRKEDAFNIFRQKLENHIQFQKCHLYDPSVEKLKEIKKEHDQFVFMLQSKKRKIGYLAIEGLREDDKEKFMILAHQFALAMRRVKLYEEIERIAITDSLTEVYTRRYALERLQEEVQRSKNRKIDMSFLMIDVDFFKSFNDSYGHLTGDQILREIGAIIRENIREIDIAGRYGGEEFCIILPDTDSSGAKFAAERIRKASEQASIKAYDNEVKVTLSIGIATFPNDGKLPSELIDKADWALYRAKKQGRNRSCAFGVYDT